MKKVYNLRVTKGSEDMLTRIKNRLYDSSKIDWENLSFTDKALWALLLPVMFEQLLNSFMGMADSMMVSRIGSAAISAVSLTDSINVLIIQVFAAMATGGAILCSQYLGQRNAKGATRAAEQVALTVFVASTVLTIISMLWRRPILKLIFGSIDQEVMDGAIIYFLVTALSYPFLALFQAGSAFYRAGGNSRFPMKISIISNVGNIIGNAVFIFVFHWGVFGAALSTLLSRAGSMLALFYFLRRNNQPIVLRDYLKIRPEWNMIRRVLAVGIPSGIENGMFQFGKLAIQSSVSTLGTAAIAAQAMTNIMENLNGIGCIGMGIGLMTVVGQCVGAGKKEEAKYFIVKVTAYSEIVLIISCLAIWAMIRPVTILAGMEPEAAAMCIFMVNWITIVKPFFWNLSFVPGYGMRAAGDVRFSMLLSSTTMWLCRVLLATVLIRVFHFGPIAVWIGMFCDWFLRGSLYLYRFLSEKWLKFNLV